MVSRWYPYDLRVSRSRPVAHVFLYLETLSWRRDVKLVLNPRPQTPKQAAQATAVAPGGFGKLPEAGKKGREGVLDCKVFSVDGHLPSHASKLGLGVLAWCRRRTCSRSDPSSAHPAI